MCDQWMPLIELPLNSREFRELPRHPAFRYEYLNGKAFLTPNVQHYHALLDLQPIAAPAAAKLRRAQPADFADLAHVFAASFRHIQPFGSLDDATRLIAARQALDRTRAGGDGPWIERASFVALAEQQPIGALFVTLLPEVDPCTREAYGWSAPPPPDCIGRRLGRPHLTWIFVDPLRAGHGTGTALLAAAVGELVQMGFRQLLSTFVIGNHSSMLWHWRNGFRLLPHIASRRLHRERQQRKTR
jgi:GNAT superfamily N-acetyltransferase